MCHPGSLLSLLRLRGTSPLNHHLLPPCSQPACSLANAASFHWHSSPSQVPEALLGCWFGCVHTLTFLTTCLLAWSPRLIFFLTLDFALHLQALSCHSHQLQGCSRDAAEYPEPREKRGDPRGHLFWRWGGSGRPCMELEVPLAPPGTHFPIICEMHLLELQ